ncbi:RNA polymerase I-specific transcription initiation factor RRN6-like protein [Pyrenochaeta sp. MPI-SDFR-AT-0127]|nr:RNA polymerase I-specific transcription initiation factor RRN6-like protein [Pyrenochaeta sp. MPI-SDFR-AT-0127]
MADRSLQNLNYGHPGAATYDLKTGEWCFGRQYTTRNLKQVQPQKYTPLLQTETVPASVQFPAPESSTTSTSVQKYVRGLVHDYPQLVAGSESIPELALVSAAIQTATATYDPLIGSLLSFGSITLEDKYEDTRRIAALPTGEAGNILRLAILTKERHGWAMDKSVWVEGPSLKDADCGYWNEEAAPLQQVVFAQSEDRSSLLAVRLPTRTVLLRPVYHRRRQAAKPSPHYSLPASVIDAHPILSIGLDETGGIPHVDVTFNPDFQFQIGLVDQKQTWSVWDIEHGRKGDAYAISRLVQGPISPSEDFDSAGEDGWSRILWIGDVNTLLVCNRRQLSIVGIKGDSFIYLPCPSLISQRSPDWILDVKRHPKDRGRFFVLTSTDLALIAVTTTSEALDATAGEAGATIMMSWRHYRGADDFTLQICVQMLSDEESCVLLHSRLNHLIQIYGFKKNPLGSVAPILSSDPGVLDLTLAGGEIKTQIHMEAMHFGETGQEAYHPGPGRSYMEQGVMFYRLFVARSDLSIHETVVYTHDLEADTSPHTVHTVESFKRSLVRNPRRDISRKEFINEEGDFIVPNGLGALESPKSKTVLQTPKWFPRQDGTSLQGFMDYTLLYEALTRTDASVEGAIESVDITAVTTQLKQMLADDSVSSSFPLGTLMEFAGLQIDVSDVDEASSRMQELFLSKDRHGVAEVYSIASGHVLDLVEDEEPSITNLYDSILQNWIAPLPPNVPIRLRQYKERLARRISAEVMLSSSRIWYHGSHEPLPEWHRVSIQKGHVSLPVLPSKPIDGVLVTTSQWPSSQQLPTTSQSSVPSSPQAPSPPPPTAASTAIADPMARLARYLQIKDSSLTPAIIPPSVNQLLAHWKPGTDPLAYEWDATERALRPEILDEGTQEQQERERKRKERRQKRQQREDELMRAKTTSQPVVFPKSSPGPMLGGIGNSSQISSQARGPMADQETGFRGPGGLDILVPMSQVEPGRFGGRPDKKKKKKGRVSGF